MNGVQLVLVVLGAIVVTAIARRRELQPALVITVVGLAASFIPDMPRLELEPDIILSVLVPPLIYSTAVNFSILKKPDDTPLNPRFDTGMLFYQERKGS